MQPADAALILRRLKETVIWFKESFESLKERLIYLEKTVNSIDSKVKDFKIKEPIDYSRVISDIQQTIISVQKRINVIEENQIKTKNEMLNIIENINEYLKECSKKPQTTCADKRRFDMMNNEIKNIEKVQPKIKTQEEIMKDIDKQDSEIKRMLNEKEMMKELEKISEDISETRR